MNTTLKPSGNFIHNFKKVWFALQILTVSVALPVICFVQIYYSGNVEKSKEGINQNSTLEMQNKNEGGNKRIATIYLPQVNF